MADQIHETVVADKNQVRQLKIKTGSVKRNIKDYTSYKKEEEKLKEKLEKAIQDGKDEHDIKQMQNAVTETSETLATCPPRVQTALDDLENLIATYNEQEDGPLKDALKQTEEWTAAEVQVAEAKGFLEALEL